METKVLGLAFSKASETYLAINRIFNELNVSNKEALTKQLASAEPELWCLLESRALKGVALESKTKSVVLELDFDREQTPDSFSAKEGSEEYSVKLLLEEEWPSIQERLKALGIETFVKSAESDPEGIKQDHEQELEDEGEGRATDPEESEKGSQESSIEGGEVGVGSESQPKHSVSITSASIEGD